MSAKNDVIYLSLTIGFRFRMDMMTKREVKIVTQNFEVFLAHHGFDSNDKDKIQEILFTEIGKEFRQQSGALEQKCSSLCSAIH